MKNLYKRHLSSKDETYVATDTPGDRLEGVGPPTEKKPETPLTVENLIDWSLGLDPDKLLDAW
jgi:hypothetical protein